MKDFKVLHLFLRNDEERKDLYRRVASERHVPVCVEIVFLGFQVQGTGKFNKKVGGAYLLFLVDLHGVMFQ